MLGRISKLILSFQQEMPTTLEIPLSGARVPVIISDEYPFRDRFKGERVIPDAILGCPALCSEDKAFAEERNIPYKQVSCLRGVLCMVIEMKKNITTGVTHTFISMSQNFRLVKPNHLEWQRNEK